MICLLGLGASVGQHLVGHQSQPARQRLQQAQRLLRRLPHSKLLAHSAVYQSRAWGNLRAGAYLNAAAVIQTRLPPGTLLQRLWQIEYACGRRRHRQRWGKRALDVDILLLANLRLHSTRLQVPHPWLWQREFALLPAAELMSMATTQQAWPRTWPASIRQRLYRVRGYHLSRPLRILSSPS